MSLGYTKQDFGTFSNFGVFGLTRSWKARFHFFSNFDFFSRKCRKFQFFFSSDFAWITVKCTKVIYFCVFLREIHILGGKRGVRWREIISTWSTRLRSSENSSARPRMHVFGVQKTPKMWISLKKHKNILLLCISL